MRVGGVELRRVKIGVFGLEGRVGQGDEGWRNAGKRSEGWSCSTSQTPKRARWNEPVRSVVRQGVFATPEATNLVQKGVLAITSIISLV